MQNVKNQPLTKSRFRLGWECPAKLYYAGRRDVYCDAMGEDSFLQGLAEGGYQVGEFARWMLCRDPVGDLIGTLDKAEALAETARRLAAVEATVAEAAFAWNGLFIRADVVAKAGNVLKLYEVKSKSWESSDSFWKKGKQAGLKSDWEEYLLDVAFQKHVVEKACPQFSVQAHLVLLDKGKQAGIDGLSRMFPVLREGRNLRIKPRIRSKSELGTDILAYLNVDKDIAAIRKLAFELPDGGTGSMDALVAQLARIHAAGKPFAAKVGAKCKSCQFRLPSDPSERRELQAKGLKSGMDECWGRVVGQGYDPDKPKVLEIWNFRKTDELIAKKSYFIEEVDRKDLGDKKLAGRQWMQVEKVRHHDPTPWIDRDGLRSALSSWRFPLHFIDFETSRMALPSHKGMPPYMQVAFQFSHHTVDAEGMVRHAGHWIETGAGTFPSFEFVRALKKELEEDAGTIFRYAAHENSVLRDLHGQLEASREPDRRDLMRWIDVITEYRPEGVRATDPKTVGSRNMVDMKSVVLDFHYDPATHGSNSLKYVLPAIVSSSASLRNRYGKPIRQAGLHSLNYPGDWVWIPAGSGNDPYAVLPPIFKGEEQESLSEYVRGLDDIDDGGAATMAYAKLQFCEVPDEERQAIRKALLRYCELDTLAMVMLYQYWQEVARTK